MKPETYQHAAMAKHVRDFLADWPLAQRSRDSYEETLGWMCEEFEHVSLKDLATSEGVRDLKTWLAETAQKKGWKPSTQRQRTAAIRTFLDWAEEEELIEHSPSKKLRPPKVKESNNRRAHPPEMIDQIRDAQRSLPDRIAIQASGDLALRRNELRLLKLADISLEDETITVQNGKGGRGRVLPMTDRLRDDCKKLLWSEPEHVYLLYPQGNPNDPYSQTGIHYWWQRCQKRAGVSGILLHELRHSAAQNMYDDAREAGLDPLQSAQELLGHSKASTTSTYLHADKGLLRNAMKSRNRPRSEDAA